MAGTQEYDRRFGLLIAHPGKAGDQIEKMQDDERQLAMTEGEKVGLLKVARR
jgi:hypothetical protein